MSETASPVLCSVDERGVAYVTLNRPEVSNAYDGALIAELLETYDALSGRDLRAVVIAGTGPQFPGRRRHQVAGRGAAGPRRRKIWTPRA